MGTRSKAGLRERIVSVSYFLKMSVHKACLIAGFISLLHVAYSAVQHRTYLRITEQEFKILPLDMVIQAVASLIVVLYSILQMMGKFKEIRASVDLQAKSWETLSNLPS